MYIFSTVPYYASYHGFTANDVTQLQGLAQKLILGRPWMNEYAPTRISILDNRTTL